MHLSIFANTQKVAFTYLYLHNKVSHQHLFYLRIARVLRDSKLVKKCFRKELDNM